MNGQVIYRHPALLDNSATVINSYLTEKPAIPKQQGEHFTLSLRLAQPY
jgi:hypothetical protein